MDRFSTDNIRKYHNIIDRYCDGEFGDEEMSMRDILEAAGEADLLDKMSKKELENLRDISFGHSKMIFIEYLKKFE